MNLIKDILRGIVIGIANVIPGVSGGTMMVSMGIYDKIIGSVTNLFKDFLKSIKTLLPYVIGMGIGIVGLAFSIEYLFEKFPFETAMLFIGLILGGLPIITRKIRGRKPEVMGIVLFILFFALIVVLQLMKVNDLSNTDISINLITIIQLFAVGMIASATMIIPGVSGSMMMMALGYYNTIIESVNGFIKEALSFHISEAMQYVGILLPFGIGVLVGIFVVAKLIEFLLKRYERLTFFAILGLVCASPIAVFSGIGISNVSAISVIVGILTFAVGFFVALKLAKE